MPVRTRQSYKLTQDGGQRDFYPIGDNDPLLVEGLEVLTTYQPVDDQWEPLGPVVQQVPSANPLSWTPVSKGDEFVLESVVEFDGILQYVGFPTYLYIGIRLQANETTLDPKKTWQLSVDVHEMLDQAVIQPIESSITSTFAYMVVYVAGLLKSITHPTVLITLDGFWATATNPGTPLFEANVVSTSERVRAVENTVMARGNGAMPRLVRRGNGWELHQPAALFEPGWTPLPPPSMAEDWVHLP
jgi:hypothetical protein